MSEVRVCEDCGLRAWSSDATVARRTVEHLDVDGTVIDAEDRVLCRSCYRRARAYAQPLTKEDGVDRGDGVEPDGGSTVGPIIFSDETARSQLVDEGVVVTFRTSDRTTGSTWWRASRTGPKRGDVDVREVGTVDPSEDADLDRYADLSGFDSVEAWRDAIRRLAGGDLPESGRLYRVVDEDVGDAVVVDEAARVTEREALDLDVEVLRDRRRDD